MQRSRMAVCVLSAVAAAFLGGCFWLAVGGAGVAAYEVGKDSRPVGTQFGDASITSRVKATLIKDPSVDAFDINVDTYQGVVTLHGHVSSQHLADRAVALSRSVKGVRAVQSKLRVIPPS